MELADFDLGAVASMSLRDASVALRAVQECEARLAAYRAAVVAHVAKLRLHRSDGHSSVAGWLRAELNCAPRTARAEQRRARLLADLPVAAAALADGEVTVDAVDAIADVHAQRRAREGVIEHGHLLVEAAKVMTYQQLQVAVRRFQACADPDGVTASHEHAREDREASGWFSGTAFSFRAQGDTESGVELMAIFDAFVDREVAADLAEARRRVGAGPGADDLARTAGQRRYDAFQAMIRAAAESGQVKLPDPLVSYVVDHHTFTEEMARLAGEQPDQRPEAAWLDRRSETTTGVVVNVRALLAAALAGKVRRLITDPLNGGVTDIGVKRRWFRGAVREAMMATHTWCTQPGCVLRVADCEIDHITEVARGGLTVASNGAPRCAGDHRRRHRLRLIDHRDPDGRFHTLRPDGTEIAPIRRGRRAPPSSDSSPPATTAA